MDMLLQIIQVFDSTLRLATPLILCAMAGLFSERSGIIDISLEGKMLAGAFAAASVSAVSGNNYLGLGAGILTAIALALLHGFACITHKGNQVVSGVAINIMALGLTVVLGIAWFAQGGQTPSLDASARFLPIIFPFAEEVRSIPVIGAIYTELLSGHNLLVYVALAAVPVTWWVVYRTRFGLPKGRTGQSKV